MLLQDKVVIVSGIGPGLGIELAVQAAAQGAKLVVAARTASKLDDAEKAVAALGLNTELIKVPTDISDREQCKNLVSQAVAKYGRVDALINSAYNPGSFEPIERANLDGWRAALDVNLFGTMNLTLEAIPQMKEQGGGAIVMVNTMVTRQPLATQGGYGASKAALSSATAHLATELGQYNIRVNSTYMGWMWGPPVEGYFDMMAKHTGADKQAMIADVEKNIPLGKIPDDADCAKAVIFLASDYACAITGAQLDVNGGEHMPH
ncbi:SDR family oxidoreductase [Oceanicoccus sp. KOV_DT_Chl]|uniref:SDR family oxidoreductase n=1 Tax=Oceanicoccus sp. KOV_DT_Chl TaxID=1904639 RepID=UPI000C7B2642|nr:SDR family oxidoreductase [Oceanicoccus sp. KOV_DT_Chl]